jgi:hypothetical protein
VKYIGQDILRRDIDNFKAALKGAKVEEAFMPVVAPSSVLPDRKDEYYIACQVFLSSLHSSHLLITLHLLILHPISLPLFSSSTPH